MKCRYCRKTVTIKREFNHQKKKWETVAVCQNCGRSFLTESHTNSSSYFSPFSILIIKAFSILLFFVLSTLYTASHFSKLKGTTHIALGIIMTAVLVILIKNRNQLLKKMILIIKKIAIKLSELIKKAKVHKSIKKKNHDDSNLD